MDVEPDDYEVFIGKLFKLREIENKLHRKTIQKQTIKDFINTNSKALVK